MRLGGLCLVLGACSSHTALPIDPACNPLGANACMTPWPSSAFEVEDPASATGRRLAIPDKTLPVAGDDTALDPAAWNEADGFSPAAPLVMSFPGGVSADGLPPNDNYDRSLQPDSPTVILDLTTGERVAHFAELDAAAHGMPDSQALYLRPAARLVGGHRYAAAITKAVHAPDGDDLPVPPGFAALRDGRHTDHELLEAMRPRFGEVLDALDDAGFPADDLVVAWDFTVASDAYLHADLTAARDRAVAALDARPQTFTITSDLPVDAQIKREVAGTFDAPLLADGSTYRAPFAAIVPACAYTAAAPVAMVLVASGDAREVASQRALAVDLCAVLVATDLRETPDAQNVVDHVALVRAMRTSFAARLFTDGDRSLVDPDRVSFYGVGHGAVFGPTLLAYEPVLARAVLAGGGANYSTLLERSTDWPQARPLAAYADPLDRALVLGLSQMQWDKLEVSSIAQPVLVPIAIGDGQVANLASYWLARSLELPILGPTPFAPWGLAVQPGPLAGGSALVILDGGAPQPPAANLPATGPSVREVVRGQPAVRRQIAAFLATGAIE